MRSHLQTFGALIMAGGSGKRMGTLTRNIPKPLLTVGNHTILDYLLGSFERHGILQENIVVVAKYLADQIHSHLSNTGVRVCTGKHSEIVLNLLDALPYLPGDFIATGCDLLSLDLLKEATDIHFQSGASTTVVICKLPDDVPRSKYWLYTIEEGLLKGLEKGERVTDIERDILVLKKSAVDEVAERIKSLINGRSPEYETYKKYSTWNLLLKVFLEQGFMIRISEKETCRCHRINLPQDLAAAESKVAQWGLIPLLRTKAA
ncbi:MAG: NDP-sugar synthase [Thermodesulfobacteriota bacterium]